MKRLITLLLIAAMVACKREPSDHPVFKYYPPTDVFEVGYVSKFYYHFYPDNSDRRAATQVGYSKTVLLDDGRYVTEDYNAGFDLTSRQYYSISADTIRSEGGISVDYRNVTDTSEQQVISNIMGVWEGESAVPFQQQFEENNKTYLFTSYQKSVHDTTILNKPAKVVNSSWDYKLAEDESVVNEGTTRSYYVQGLGFFGSDSKGSSYSRKAELIEQMSVEEFENRANHGEHRVAWIDPEKSMSDDSNFQLCGNERKIADYYNSTPDGRYLHNKRAMMDTIYSNMDHSKLFDQSGRLVFRFVVNCEGKAGRFIAEGYDLNYQRMEFEQGTIDHLYSILQKLEDWRPVIIRDEARDAYFYITFNIKNGEIIDILP